MRPVSHPSARFLLFALTLVCAAHSAVASQSSDRTSSAPVLVVELSVEPATGPTTPAMAASAKAQETLLLTLRNEGTTDYELPRDLEHVWKITLHSSTSDAQIFDSVSWSNTQVSGTLAPGQAFRSQATTEFALPQPSEGVYTLEAEFLPTHIRAFEKFRLPSSSSLNLLFTGKLMGYYRLPDRQPYDLAVTPGSCPSPEANGIQPSRDAQSFLDAFPPDTNVRGNVILVGTGDNFAPNYYSRVFNPAPPSHEHQPGKDLYVGDAYRNRWNWYGDPNASLANQSLLWNGHGRILTDNVACFLSLAHYAAIVPGKHDFYYGAERLRELARFLASIPEDGRFQRVQMLAANMVIKTTWAKDHAPIPDSGKPVLKFVTKYIPDAPVGAGYQNLEITDFTDGGFTFPWLQFIRVTATGWPTEHLSALEVYLCEASKNPDDFLTRPPADTFCNHERRLSPDAAATAAAGQDANPSGETPAPTDPVQLVFRIPDQRTLLPRHNYAVCIFGFVGTVPKTKPYCLRFSVFDPFFQSPNWPETGHTDYTDPLPYFVRKSATAPVVIFGVVAPQLLERVGGDNLAWKTVQVNPEKLTGVAAKDLPSSKAPSRNQMQYNTQVAIADPVQSLMQLQDYFESQNPGFRGLRVLLAQMPPEQAKELAEHLPKCSRFDVVISEADDALATPNQIVQVRPTELPGNNIPSCPDNAGASGLKMAGQKSNFMNGSLISPPTLLLVPPTHETSTVDNLSRFAQIRRLQLNPHTGGRRRDYVLSGVPIPIPVPDAKPLVQASSSFWAAVCRAIYKDQTSKPCDPATLNWDSSVKKAAVQQIALWAMQQRWHADVALLQERDFYLGGFEDYLADHCTSQPDTQRPGGLVCTDNSVPELDVQEILDRIIWKGDYLRVRSIPGSVLKSILKQSDTFAKSQKTVYLPLAEANRPLVSLGTWPDPVNGGDFLINGKPLDSAQLYTVVTSDYIELGDTGYPDLATPPVGDPPQPANSTGPFTTISNLTCQALAMWGLASTPDRPRLAANCEGRLQRKGYYDELANRTPDDPRPGNTNWHKFYAWSIFQPHLGQPEPKPTPVPSGPDAIRNHMQQRLDALSNWDWTFDKLSVGFSGLTHNNSQQEISKEFGGVQNAQVNAKHTHSWDWDANSKYTLYHPNFDWFGAETLQYSSSFVTQTSAPRAETQSRNLFAIDGGVYLHPWNLWSPWKNKSLPQFSLVLSGHFETQPGNPITNITMDPVPPSTTSLTLTFPQGRTNLLLGRPGVRWQDRKSYVEGGLEGGKTLNAIQQFSVLVAPGGPAVPPCLLEASVSLTKCLNNFNAAHPTTPVTPSSLVTVTRHPEPRYGAYWTMGLTVPMHPNVSYNFQETSDYFFLSHGDNSADTRFRHQLVHTLKLNVFPNLSFEPTYTIFLYENKLDYHFLFQQQYSVKINYSFDCSNWHECRNEFRYKKPSPQ